MTENTSTSSWATSSLLRLATGALFSETRVTVVFLLVKVLAVQSQKFWPKTFVRGKHHWHHINQWNCMIYSTIHWSCALASDNCSLPLWQWDSLIWRLPCISQYKHTLALLKWFLNYTCKCLCNHGNVPIVCGLPLQRRFSQQKTSHLNDLAMTCWHTGWVLLWHMACEEQPFTNAFMDTPAKHER